MKATFRATKPDDHMQVSSLLAQAFDAHPAASLLDSATMAWKYWDARGDWPGPRSYVLERDGRLVAHAGIWPVSFEGENAVRGVQLIDWCAAKDSPGAGMALVQKFAAMFDFMYSIGGSDMTRKVLPACGFIEVTHAWTGARPLRPLRQMLTHQAVNWKLAPRFVRNCVWSSSPAKRSNPGWQTVAMQPSDTPSGLIPVSQPCFSVRSPAFFEYLLRCPSIPYRLHGISNENGLQGYFALGVLRGQARIGGVWLRRPCEEHWRAAYTLAQEAALQLKGAYEIVATGSIGPSGQAAVLAGLRIMRDTPVFLLNKHRRLTLPRDFQFQMSDDDAAFLDLGEPSYYT
jgi:hypothetical protein